MSYMFYNADVFNQDISGWNTSNVVAMHVMFYNADAFDQDISAWNTGSVTSMRFMFYNADAFDQDISGWNFNALNSSADLTNFMALTPGLSTANYDALLIAWDAARPTIFTPLSPGMGGSQFTLGSAAETARNNLIAYGWTITDSGGV